MTRIALFRACRRAARKRREAVQACRDGLNEASKNQLTDFGAVCIISLLCCRRSNARNTGSSVPPGLFRATRSLKIYSRQVWAPDARTGANRPFGDGGESIISRALARK